MKKEEGNSIHGMGFYFHHLSTFVSIVLQWDKIPARILICCFLQLLL